MRQTTWFILMVINFLAHTRHNEQIGFALKEFYFAIIRVWRA